jgi:hypothetical protein
LYTATFYHHSPVRHLSGRLTFHFLLRIALSYFCCCKLGMDLGSMVTDGFLLPGSYVRACEMQSRLPLSTRHPETAFATFTFWMTVCLLQLDDECCCLDGNIEET